MYSFASRLYKGLTVCYSYIAEKAQISYDSFGVFNGGTPPMLEVTIEDVKVGELSIMEYISEPLVEGLQNELSQRISERW
jgi:hypothetical protein